MNFEKQIKNKEVFGEITNAKSIHRALCGKLWPDNSFMYAGVLQAFRDIGFSDEVHKRPEG